MRMRCAAVDLQLLEHGVAKRPLGQHALHRDLQHTLRLLGLQLREVDLVQLSGLAAVAVVDLVLRLAAGDAKLCRVHHDDVVAGIDVRRVLRLMLAAQARGDLRGEASEDLALRVDDVPAVVDLADFRGVGCHT